MTTDTKYSNDIIPILVTIFIIVQIANNIDTADDMNNVHIALPNIIIESSSYGINSRNLTLMPTSGIFVPLPAIGNFHSIYDISF